MRRWSRSASTASTRTIPNYDGKFWSAAVAQLYGIESIPAPFLVDGDTGKILAIGESLRGPNLVPTVKAALEKKSAEQKKPT